MRRLRSAATVFTIAALLAACSSGATPPEPPPTTHAPATAEHGSLAHCLAEHGMPAAPGPVAGPPPGVDPTHWHEAMQACSPLAPGPAS